MTNHARFFFLLPMNPPLSLLPAAVCAPINHLLAQEPWARDKLLPHAGKVACLDAGGGMAIRLRVRQEGLVEVAEADLQPNVTIRIKLADLPLIMQNRERAFSYVKLEGDADFANAISQVSQTLRWEAEEDLSKWVGDIAAVRIVSGTKAVVESIKATQQTLTENVAEYFLEENPMLMRPQPVADFAADVAKLRDGVERLAKRIEKLTGPT
jgi:ubiquinone biosynthesis protein UbiJ